MNEPKPFASLSPTLLARKGAARPAMRPQLQPMSTYRDSLARQDEDDLGWNDMGFDIDPQLEVQSQVQPREAEIVPIAQAAAPAEPVAYEPPLVEAPVPAVVRQQAEIAERVAKPIPRLPATPRPRRSALADGRRAAFTLRVDAERHLKLRLACTLSNRSAQQMVTEALDRLLDELPEVATLAAQVRNR